MPEGERILVVDDEKNVCTVIREGLEARGFQAYSVLNADQALEACQQNSFDLALVDLRLPGSMDGLELLSELHSRHPQMVIIMLTAYASLDSSIAALRSGAYDYILKPASLNQIVESVEKGLAKKRQEAQRYQVIARLEETLRALKQEDTHVPGEARVSDRFIQTSNLTIDRQKRLAVLKGKPLALTATEFDLLEHLARHCDRVVTAHELVKMIQGYDLSEVDARPIIRVHIQRLRQKLEDDPENPTFVLNVRGKGYRFGE